MSLQNFNEKLFSKIITKYSLFLLIIITMSIGIRFYFLPTDVPLNIDSLYYFWYSSDIYQNGKLPDTWSPNNNGWPIFVSIFFTISDSKDIFTLMQLQRILSVLISVAIIIPTYFICKKFVIKKYSVIGASIIAFDPRLMINSFLGVTDPLYLLLITTGLASFLYSSKKTVYFSFILISFATIIRAEGVAFFLVLSIIFFIKYRNDRLKIFLKYFVILGIFVLIVLPMSIYRIDVIGTDGIFIRGISGGENLMLNLTNEDSKNSVFNASELFIKYLIWVLIPNFIIFVPLGLFLIFQNRNFEKKAIIISLGIMAIPAFYAYTIPAQDTRYLFVLFPMFSVLSVLSIERIIGKINRSNIIIILIILAIIISSLLFYEYKKIDYDHEKEAFEIMKKISSMVNGTNTLYPESSYLKTSQTIDQWPKIHSEMGLRIFKIITISTDNFNSLEKYVVESKEKGLTHIMVDNKKDSKDFIIDIFENEENFTYLKKIYDSKIDGFTYQVKVFKIDYEEFDFLVNKEIVN